MNNFGVFFSEPWLDAVCGDNGFEIYNLEYKDSTLSAAFKKDRFGPFKRALVPDFSPYNISVRHQPDQSSFSCYQKELELHKLLLQKIKRHNQIKIKCAPLYSHIQPYLQDKFQLNWAHTCIIKSNAKSPDELLLNMYANTRNLVCKQSDILIQYNHFESLSELWKHNPYYYHSDLNIVKFMTLVQHQFYKENFICFSAHNADQQTIAVLILTIENGMCHQLFNIIHPEFKTTDASYKLIWESIRWASEKKFEYNFEGSMLYKLERIFKSFGGELVPYCLINKFKPSILELMSKWK